MKLHDRYQLSRNFIHRFTRLECLVLSMVLFLGAFFLEMPHNVVHSSFDVDAQMEYTVLQPRTLEMQAGTREIRGQRVRPSCITESGRRIQEEDLRTLVFFFLLLTGSVLLTLKQVSVNCYHTQSHGKVSIVRYMHVQDGEK